MKYAFYIFGYGAMGAAMSHHLYLNGHSVVVYPSPYDNKDNIPSRLLSPIDPNVENLPVLVVATSRSGVNWAIQMIKQDFDTKPLYCLILTKGLIPTDNNLFTVSQYMQQHINCQSYFAISGPCIANEMLQGEPTSVVLSGSHYENTMSLASLISSGHYKINTSTDIDGSQWAAALKNIYSILIMATSAHTFNTQENFNAALFTAIHKELSQILECIGGSALTAFGESGLGDIWVTCRKGRNGQFGHQWGGSSYTAGQIKKLFFPTTTVEGYQLASAIAKSWLNQTQFSQFKIITQTIHAMVNDHTFDTLYQSLQSKI